MRAKSNSPSPAQRQEQAGARKTKFLSVRHQYPFTPRQPLLQLAGPFFDIHPRSITRYVALMRRRG
jgi:hypothetical protein